MKRPNRRLRATVLAIDDEPDVLESLRVAFEALLPDVELLTAESGAKGLEIMAKKNVTLVIVDFRMPEMDGLQFLVEAHRRQPNLRSLMLTAYPDPTLAQRAKTEAGASLVIAKPFDVEILTGAVDFMLNSRPRQHGAAKVPSPETP